MYKQLLILALTAIAGPSLAQEPCKTPNSRNGLCIALTGCRTLLRLVEKRPIPASSAALLRASACGNFQNNVPNVCCPLRNNTDSSSKLTLLPDTNICGNDPNDNKIVGGTVTALDEFPWMALLEYQRGNTVGHYCGGMIISERYILTAAHCVNNPQFPAGIKLNAVRLGEYDTSSNPDCTEDDGCANEHVTIPIESTKVHELYDPQHKNQQHDISLIRLKNPITFTDFVKPICLPSIRQELLTQNFEGTSPTIAGWGKTERDSLSQVKLKVSLPIQSRQRCSQNFASLGITLAQSQICAGGQPGKDSCRGDSGGPLMLRDVKGKKGNWFAIGIASFGPTPCGLEGWGGVYTKIGEYNDWILKNIQQ